MTHDIAQGELLIAALRAAQREGNPVLGGDPQRWGRIIRIASIRWSTFERRHPPAADTLSARTEDLARALLQRCTRPAGRGTPIDITDCRRLARRLATILCTSNAAIASIGAHPVQSLG